MRFTMAVLLTTILMAPVWAQNSGACVPATTHGTYSVECSGFMSPAAGAPQVPVSVLGTTTGDWGGTFTGSAKVSLGGTIVDQTVKGTLVGNSDCTGSISYTQKINGQPAPTLNIVAHTLDDGKEIVGMSVDAGVNMICHLKLMTRTPSGQ